MRAMENTTSDVKAPRAEILASTVLCDFHKCIEFIFELLLQRYKRHLKSTLSVFSAKLAPGWNAHTKLRGRKASSLKDTFVSGSILGTSMLCWLYVGELWLVNSWRWGLWASRKDERGNVVSWVSKEDGYAHTGLLHCCLFYCWLLHILKKWKYCFDLSSSGSVSVHASLCSLGFLYLCNKHI